MDLPQSLGDEFDGFITEDELQITVAEKDRQIRVRFSRPVKWFELEPLEAMELGHAIICRALEMSKRQD